MDETDLLKMAGVSTTGVAIVLFVYRILKTIQGKKLISSCCGKKMEVGIDVAPMTPHQEQTVIHIKNPMGSDKPENLDVYTIKNGTQATGIPGS